MLEIYEKPVTECEQWSTLSKHH